MFGLDSPMIGAAVDSTVHSQREKVLGLFPVVFAFSLYSTFVQIPSRCSSFLLCMVGQFVSLEYL